MAKTETIDAVPILSKWYGPDSIACHRVRIISEKQVESEFVVGENLCGVKARPPMFDRLILLQDNEFTTETSADDAKEHFIEGAGITVVPHHKIEGLTAEALKQTRYPDSYEGVVYVVSFDFMRLRDFVLPHQGVSFAADIQRDLDGATGTFKMSGQRRPFAKNLRIEGGNLLGEEARQRLLAQHWITEANAQGMGIVGLQSAPEGTAPVLMEVGRSTFYKVTIFAGDTLVSRFNVRTRLNNQIMGDAETFVRNTLVAREEELLLNIYPISSLKERIEQSRQGVIN